MSKRPQRAASQRADRLDRPDATAALERLADLWLRERDTTRARFAAERDALTLEERARQGLALRDLSVVESEPAPGGLTMVWVTPRRAASRWLDALRLGPGDPAVLWRTSPKEADAVRGTIARRRGERLGVMVRDDLPEAFEEGGFALDREEPEATFQRGAAAIRRFRQATAESETGRLREVLFGGQPARFRPEPALTPLDPDLNEPQRAAVARALAAQDVALIHGPPGTGKTRTLVEVIRQVVAEGGRVLAVAASNLAVDNLAERLADLGVELVRLGHPARVSPAVEPRLLNVVVHAHESAALAREWMAEAHRLRTQLAKRWARRSVTWAERKEEQGAINRLFRDARVQLQRTQEAVLAEAPVVCATAAGADAELLGDLRFDLVVLDEATQAPDPIALVALGRGPRAVLAGDPCQLPPTVIDLNVAREGLATTLFERLAAREAGGEDLLRMLVVQHRMHEAIMTFPSESMYQGRLVAAPSVAGHTLEDLGAQPDPLRPEPFVFVDTAGKGWEEEREVDDPSTRNPGQAQRVAREVRRLIGRGLAPSQVAVITPYSAQVRLLQELLAAEVVQGLEVRSVDGFQGREQEAVVVDLVRSNDQGALGFLEDTRRMNVALSRARRFLLVVGDSATIGQHPYYERFLDVANRLDGYVSAWSDEAEPE